MFVYATDSAYIDRLSASVVKQGEFYVVAVELYVYSAVTENSEIHVYLPQLNVDQKLQAQLQRDKMNKVVANVTVAASKVKLWWPNGYGQQNLYDVTAVATVKGESIRSETIQVGFRTIELIQDFVDPSDALKGRHFYFRVNDVPVFLKGSNWIPVSSFPARNFTERIEFLLESAREIGMNALRLWGGGRFETDDFYRMADRKGILLWHDLIPSNGVQTEE
uniref:Glyco_hydro_2 domain-containing protein n=1 Tax=Steinernema glaseri TaxID=37863 RepID=A0A1I7YUG0_9BILA